MNEADALDIVQYAIWTVLTLPARRCGRHAVGIGIALIQALTQIQEITLTFVPKIVAIMLVVALTGPFIGSQISAFTNVIFERIETGSRSNSRKSGVAVFPKPRTLALRFR